MTLHQRPAGRPEKWQSNRAGLVDEDGRAITPPADDRSAIPTIPPKYTLMEALERYLAGKGLGRSDMFRVIVAAIVDLQRRVSAMDEEAVAELGRRMDGLEQVIGAAFKDEVAERPRRGRPPKNKEAANG